MAFEPKVPDTCGLSWVLMPRERGTCTFKEPGTCTLKDPVQHLYRMLMILISNFLQKEPGNWDDEDELLPDFASVPSLAD